MAPPAQRGSEGGDNVPKYLLQVNYTAEGAKGVLKDGGTARRDVVEKLVKGMGGTVEAFYFCFGKYDVVLIVDAPDNVSIAAASLTVGASGAAEVQTTTLLTPEEVDQISKRKVNYTPPGAARAARATRATGRTTGKRG